MEERGFERNRGTIKAGPKDLRGRYCLQPFTNVDVHSNEGVRCCSESWMPAWIGDLSKQSLREIWNGDRVQEIRRSVLDGSYAHCDWHQCPFYCNDALYLYSRAELEDPASVREPHRRLHLQKHVPWLRPLLEGKTAVELMPANYNLAYDESCNLACPSCRKETVFHNTGAEYQRRAALQARLLAEIEAVGFDQIGRINVTGSGEPFASRVFTELLFQFDGRKYPGLDINLQSNGVLFTPAAWERMWRIHGNVNEVIISIDAARPETYAQIRVNGDFHRLWANLEFLAGLRKAGKIRRLMLGYVVQQRNYTEMAEATHRAKALGVDLLLFNLVTDWMSWTREQFEAQAIWKEYHPEFPRFLEALEDPVFDDPMVDLGNMREYRDRARAAADEGRAA